MIERDADCRPSSASGRMTSPTFTEGVLLSLSAGCGATAADDWPARPLPELGEVVQPERSRGDVEPVADTPSVWIGITPMSPSIAKISGRPSPSETRSRDGRRCCSSRCRCGTGRPRRRRGRWAIAEHEAARGFALYVLRGRAVRVASAITLRRRTARSARTDRTGRARIRSAARRVDGRELHVGEQMDLELGSEGGIGSSPEAFWSAEEAVVRPVARDRHARRGPCDEPDAVGSRPEASGQRRQGLRRAA